MIKLVDARKGLYEKCVELFHNEKVAERIYMYLCDGIEECDEVELERKKGEWISQENDDLKISDYCCSVCGTYRDDIENYCPNCGADMRGEK